MARALPKFRRNAALMRRLLAVEDALDKMRRRRPLPKFRRDGTLMGPDTRWEEVFLITGKAGSRPTVFVRAMITNESDRKWFEGVIAALCQDKPKKERKHA